MPDKEMEEVDNLNPVLVKLKVISLKHELESLMELLKCSLTLDDKM